MDELDIEERRQKILDMLTQRGRVKVAELSRLFNISEVTIRNDLSDLESLGLLERVHGGAVGTNKAYYNMSFFDRMHTNEPEKRRIAGKAAELISDGDTILINSGTTTLFVAQELKNVKNLTVVTNAVSIALEIGHYSNIHVILLGGNFNPQYQFTYGDDTINQLRRYKADKLILAADGVSAADGITTYHHFEAEVNRQMIIRVNKTIVVADHSKIARTSFAFIDEASSIDTLVTNEKAGHEELDALKEKGIDIYLV
ncbi:MAG: DeoR/GlpR family DNA-binding transcription regulator [Bacillota bacterium]